jgi:hypothetical protein
MPAGYLYHRANDRYRRDPIASLLGEMENFHLKHVAVNFLASEEILCGMTLLDQACGIGTWWSKPEWYSQQRHGSIRDLCRLFWRHRSVLSQLWVALEEREKPCQAPALQENTVSSAA